MGHTDYGTSGRTLESSAGSTASFRDPDRGRPGAVSTLRPRCCCQSPGATPLARLHAASSRSGPCRARERRQPDAGAARSAGEGNHHSCGARILAPRPAHEPPERRDPAAGPRAVRCRGLRRSDEGLRALARDGADADRKSRGRHTDLCHALCDVPRVCRHWRTVGAGPERDPQPAGRCHPASRVGTGLRDGPWLPGVRRGDSRREDALRPAGIRSAQQPDASGRFVSIARDPAKPGDLHVGVGQFADAERTGARDVGAGPGRSDRVPQDGAAVRSAGLSGLPVTVVPRAACRSTA